MEGIVTIITELLIDNAKSDNHLHCVGEFSEDFIELLEKSIQKQNFVSSKCLKCF